MTGPRAWARAGPRSCRATTSSRSGSIAKDHVLFASRLVPTYGGAGKNYYVSRILWALRNTPGYTNVQPFVYVFLPKDLLAKAMWASGAREMTLANFVERFASAPEKKYWSFFDTQGRTKPEDVARRLAARGRFLFEAAYHPILLMSNDGGGDPVNAGKSYFVCRWKDNGKGTGTVCVEQNDPPGCFKKILQGLNWNETYLHPQLVASKDAIESATPDLFKDIRAAPPPPAAVDDAQRRADAEHDQILKDEQDDFPYAFA